MRWCRRQARVMPAEAGIQSNKRLACSGLRLALE
jgi:hypothetical protein